MERSDGPDQPDDEPFAFRPPLPPEDRVWRHPSELGAAPFAASGLAASSRRAEGRRLRLALVVVTSAAGALLVAAAIGASLGASDGRASDVVERSASSFTFAPTTLPDALGLSRPPDGVVHLVTFTPSGQQLASGVVLDARGTIATTVAAVRGAGPIVAYLADGSRLSATLLGSDEDSGAAVVRVPAQPLAASSGWAVTLASGDQVHTGDGATTATVETLGVTATAAGHTLQHLVRLRLDDSAAVAEGTPLLDDHEQVVGLATHAADGQLYAVPIEIPRAAARSINVHGRVVVPWLGVSADDDATEGAVVAKVIDGSPAAAAGLQAGDVIVSIDGQPVASMAVLALWLRDYDAGAVVDLAYRRGGQLHNASAVLSERH